MAQVELKNVSKIYSINNSNQIKALDNINLNIEKGDFVVILGASGAGKSTLLNILGGMDTLTSGTFKVEDKVISSFKEKDLGIYRRENVGFVFQFYNLLPNLTALENIQISESLAKNPLSSIEVLNSVGLSKRASNFPSELSGGEQQRIAIARAIVKNPTLLLCDEPTGALDSKTGAMIIKLLIELNEKYKKTIVIVTHNSKIAEIARRVIRIQDGKIFNDLINIDVKSPEEINW